MSASLDSRQNAARLKDELIQVVNRLHPNKSAAADLRYCETLLARVVDGFVRSDSWQFSGKWHKKPSLKFKATCLRKDGTVGETIGNFWQAEEPDRYTVVWRSSEAISQEGTA